jgi:hypothetical protein
MNHLFAIKEDCNGKLNLYRIVTAKQPGAMNCLELIAEEAELPSLVRAIQGLPADIATGKKLAEKVVVRYDDPISE